MDKIIERSTQEAAPVGKEPYQDVGRDQQRYPQGDRQYDYKHKHHKRKSLLGELFDFDLGIEPASENRIRSCRGLTPTIRFYCKPVTLVRCREIRGEIRFSGRVGGKWLWEMTSAFIIKELRGARALRLFCARSAHPPPRNKNKPMKVGFFCVLYPGNKRQARLS